MVHCMYSFAARRSQLVLINLDSVASWRYPSQRINIYESRKDPRDDGAAGGVGARICAKAAFVFSSKPINPRPRLTGPPLLMFCSLMVLAVTTFSRRSGEMGCGCAFMLSGRGKLGGGPSNVGCCERCGVCGMVVCVESAAPVCSQAREACCSTNMPRPRPRPRGALVFMIMLLDLRNEGCGFSAG